ncbi:MAG: hypothetical protein ACRC8F_00060 [Cetobacterium sp.]
MSGAIDAVTGVFDTVTGDALDLDSSKKKEAKKVKNMLNKQNQDIEEEKKKEKKKQLDSKKSFYESMRDGNLSMLDNSLEQKIG